MDAVALGLAAAALLLGVATVAHLLTARRLQLEARGRSLEGELVIVNTPRPDDQTIRGTVVRELPGRELLLAGAVYLEREPGRGGEVVREVSAGDVRVHYAWLQILYPTASEPR